MAPDKNGRVVFIGNIPYGVSEEQIVDTFGRVGQVNNFRLVHDKETGRPKGFGFLEYADPDAAASAVRNLNDHEIMGRKLRVDWSNDNSSGSSGNRNDGSGGPTDGAQMNPMGGDVAPSQAPLLPTLPPGTDVPIGLTCPDAISKTLASLPAPQLLDIISQLKGLVMSDPAQATELLRQAPQLAYAVFQALLLLGLVDTSMLGSIVQAAGPQAPAYAPPPQPAAVMPPVPPQNPYAATPQPGYPAYPPQQFQQPPAPTPPVQQPAYQPPPQPQAQPNQQELLAQVMAMTREQVYALEPSARQQIIALRSQLGAPV
ncbi:hypothetical protein AAFC00_001223 [Neodothiora populina]|uniref:RRM domain-containing protein n=1 Tax=Neodothiora populina TaxID=2781224 RepID=A0ABR3PNB7_9PEZI